MRSLIPATCLLLLAAAASPAGAGSRDISGLQPWLVHEQPDKHPGQPPPPGSPMLPGGDCSDYVDLSGQELPIVTTGTTVGATNNYGPFPIRPPCWEHYWDSYSCTGPDVTYKWTAPATGKYTISLVGSGYDTCLLLYDFTCPTEPVYPDDFICGNDDWIGSDAGLFAMSFTAGQEVLIVVDGYGYLSGPFQLAISEYERAADLDTFISDTMASEHIPGLAACAIWNGVVFWKGNYGYADIEHGVAVEDSTAFLMASVSKPVVGTALMQLWEEGLLGLDNDIDEYLPFEVNNPYVPDSAMTFRTLMTHTSGLNDYWPTLNSVTTWGGDSPIALGQFLEDYLTQGGLYYGLQNFNPWPPGQREDYCNVGAALTGYLVERIADANGLGSSFEAYCQDSLFAPLSMDHTSWFLANLDSSNVAVPYRWTGSRHVRYPHYGTPFYPAMQLRTSTLQFARFLTAFMRCGEVGGVRILDCPTVELMTTVQYPEVTPTWGLFWSSVHDGGRWLWAHTGSYSGYRTAIAYCPDENSGVIVLTNGESTAHLMIAHEIFEYVAAVTVPSSLADDRHAMPVTLALHQNYPNPFNPATTIPYELSTAREVTLRVYNLHGRLVRSLLDHERCGAGRHFVRWAGENDSGRGAASGVYVYRLEVGDQTMSRTLVLAR